MTKQNMRELNAQTSAAIQELNALTNRLVLLDAKIRAVFEDDNPQERINPKGPGKK